MPAHSQLFRRHIALPSDHGSWVFLLSPLLIGLYVGGRWDGATAALCLGALAAFLARQPLTIAVKVFSGRRPKDELPTAIFWLGVYSFVGLISLIGLMITGAGYVLMLALPAFPILAWHLVLVSRRAERRQMGVELVGTGVLALAAPAAYWLALGYPDPVGLWLWALTWFQSAASVVYAYLRLEQRALSLRPTPRERLAMAGRALLYTTFNLLAAITLAWFNIVPRLIFLPYLLQWLETLWGTWFPAVGVRPTVIGVRQLLISTMFTLLFVMVWR